MIETDQTNQNDKEILKDHLYLITKVNELIQDPENGFVSHSAKDLRECEKIGYGENKKGNVFVVMAEDTVVELGSPKTKSVSTVLWTKKDGIVGGPEGTRIWISGKELSDIRQGSVSFLQFIIVQLSDDEDPTDFRLYRLKNLTNKIPGYMTRSIPDKIWVRINKKLMKKKFSLYALGQCLVKSYQESVKGLKAIDIILAADNKELVSQFESICNAAKVISGENKKLKWEADGVVSCDDLNCDVCEEQPTCDTLKDVVVKKLRKGD